MTLVSGVQDMQRASAEVRQSGRRLGVVPTMGYLHDGHLSLIRIARQHADVVVTTIFVNPTQFGPHEDFERYPRDIERDKQLAGSAGSDFIFTPSVDEMYPPDFCSVVHVGGLSEVLEGAVRPGHFRGVTTVVAKLFNITNPHVAVFGQKDAQQAVIIRRMVQDLNFDLEIIVAPIVREADGLAMSSRNVYLSPSEREQSVILSKSLRLAEELVSRGIRDTDVIIGRMKELILKQPVATIEYVSVAEASSLSEVKKISPGREVLISLAVKFGATRLIDNTLITV